MRLVELDPKWLQYEGRRVGLLFLCPHCKKTWLTVFVEKFPAFSGYKPFEDAEREWCTQDSQYGIVSMVHGFEQRPIDVIACNKDCAWVSLPPIADATFENISFTPSLDASRAGHWHGFITNGEVA